MSKTGFVARPFARIVRAIPLVAALALAGCLATPVTNPPTRASTLTTSLPPMKLFPSAPVFTSTRPNAEIAEDFLDLAFRLENGRLIPRLTRFEEPITVRFNGPATETAQRDLSGLLTRLRQEADIDISLSTSQTANIAVEFVDQTELQRALPGAACFVVPRVSSWSEFKAYRRTPQVDWTTLERRDRAAIFIPAGVAPQEVRDCLHEELAQALGPLNDLYRLPDSVFNDDNLHAVLTSFDMLVLRMYYAPELRNGMTRGEVGVRLPSLLARVNPQGERPRTQIRNDTSRDWIDAIEVALTRGNSDSRRRNAAETAINLGRSYGWRDNRAGFALFAYGRLQVRNDASLARSAFKAADRYFAQSPYTQIHRAHVAVQLAAYALSAGDAEQTLEITNAAIPIARAHENAAILATLMMFKAEALTLQGNEEQAEAIRLDSLGWARYGFGTEANVRARLSEVAGLNPT